ncbi:hypothetical protein [Nostoc sp. PA-18-2419]|uniref:hypothetical protein n=1 Tax=Nostoc sp. PA-18-2419 TaxID=2575443 RepID=UPI0011081699|nr:hypothetical protein [Nostoc sp. PA-18-2419]
MAITFNLEKLTSRVVRSKVGTRIIRGMEEYKTSNGSTGNGALDFVGFVFNASWSLTGFLLGNIGGYFKFSWTTFWSWFVATKQFLWNFNWNATDEQLDASIKSRWTALAGQLGGTIGNALGYIACGIVPAAAIMVFNEPLGAYTLARVTEEALEEFLENFGALLKSTLLLGTQIFITETFKSVRKLIKSNSKLVKKYFGSKAEKAVQAWGEKNSKPWSFANANEEYLDKTFGEEGAGREFAEELQEEADEACVEAGYVVANSVDTWLSQDMLTQRHTPPMGENKYVEIVPNREVPDERIVLGGREELLKPVIIQTLATHEQFNGRDMGIIYGSIPADMPERRHRPEVVLKFYCKQNKNPSKGAITDALSMQIAFRLMNKGKEDFATDEYLKKLANAIHREFATPPLKIEKGRQTYTYSDFEKGYQFKLDVKNETEAKRIIKKVLDIQQHKFDDDKFRVGSKKANGVIQTIPDKVTIRGKIEEIPISGKSGIVTFQYAYLNVGVNVPPINLIDLTGKKKDVVYKPS